MHPILLQLPEAWPLVGGFKIHSYGLMIALGFLVGMMIIKKESRRLNLDVDRMMDIFFYALVAGLIGARILYVVHSVNDFWADPLVIFRVWEGGLVFQGGVIGAALVMIYLCRHYKIKFLAVADVFIVGLTVGHALGRIGCFFAGCCHGVQCDPGFLFAVTFPAVADSAAPPGIPLYPTQLFEAFGEIVLFFILWGFRKHKKFDGAVFFLYLILYSILRSSLELIRGDVIRGFVVEPYLSNAQFISLLAVIVSVFAWLYLNKKNKA